MQKLSKINSINYIRKQVWKCLADNPNLPEKICNEIYNRYKLLLNINTVSFDPDINVITISRNSDRVVSTLNLLSMMSVLLSEFIDVYGTIPINITINHKYLIEIRL